jgi:hypothetical protein
LRFWTGGAVARLGWGFRRSRVGWLGLGYSNSS